MIVTSNHNSIPDLPPGISLVFDYCSGPLYKGTAEALISAGLIRPEWIVDLGKQTRTFVINADGGFTIPYPDGRRGSYSHEYRRRGVTTIKRDRQPDFLLVTKYRTKEEERERDRQRLEQVAAERQEWEDRRCERAHQRAHNQDFQDGVKEARADRVGEYLDKMHDCLTVTGGTAYSPDSEARILRLLDELRRAFAEARMVPTVPRYHTEGNLIHFPRAGGQEARP